MMTSKLPLSISLPRPPTTINKLLRTLWSPKSLRHPKTGSKDTRIRKTQSKTWKLILICNPRCDTNNNVKVNRTSSIRIHRPCHQSPARRIWTRQPTNKWSRTSQHSSRWHRSSHSSSKVSWTGSQAINSVNLPHQGNLPSMKIF